MKGNTLRLVPDSTPSSQDERKLRDTDHVMITDSGVLDTQRYVSRMYRLAVEGENTASLSDDEYRRKYYTPGRHSSVSDRARVHRNTRTHYISDGNGNEVRVFAQYVGIQAATLRRWTFPDGSRFQTVMPGKHADEVPSMADFDLSVAQDLNL